MQNAWSLYTEPLSMSKDLLLNANQNFVFFPLTRHSGDWSTSHAIVLVNKEPQALNYKKNTFHLREIFFIMEVWLFHNALEAL